MSKEAMKLALQALEESHPEAYRHIITAIREALAQQPAQQGCMRCNTPKKCALYGCSPLTWPAEQPAQHQEPVVWMYVNRSTHETVFQKHMRSFVDHSQWKEAPLYGEPLANHELQCVCGAVWCGDEMVHLPDKRPPASKPWVGLTEEDKQTAFDDTQEGGGFWEFADAIEAKLKDKNA